MLYRRVAEPWGRAPKPPLGDSCLPQTPCKRNFGEPFEIWVSARQSGCVELLAENAIKIASRLNRIAAGVNPASDAASSEGALSNIPDVC
jgi:hypothetical protein